MKWILLTICALSLTSCSYLTEFYIYNTSEGEIHITYTTKRVTNQYPFITNPVVKDFRSFTRVKDPTQPKTIALSADSLTIKVTLLPKQALYIGAESNFNLNSASDRHDLVQNLESLHIVTSTDSITLTPDVILPYFEEFDYEHVGIIFPLKKEQ
ncbi:hypothetical protein G5B37_04645 [Rasiella rasia]|uniref:Lipoprotein n=1 Tax=Rasiella rasia TaxID=2744027 RepID=A0A6G6GK28_9FLAO|nr:hypothetical protein [Rasiella rasia]QIE58874.1 hypothetical protein G5B37_04645 [Rasiella rasia]